MPKWEIEAYGNTPEQAMRIACGRMSQTEEFPITVNSYNVNKSIMSTAVYSIRLEDATRKMMDDMSDVNWQSEIRQMVEDLVREKKKQRFLEKARELRQKMKPIGASAAEMIREDRDAR